jgi:hypothetical protein
MSFLNLFRKTLPPRKRTVKQEQWILQQVQLANGGWGTEKQIKEKNNVLCNR